MTVQPIGGEMLHWSDLDGAHGPAPAGDAVFRPLVAGLTGRTLVAGPHDPALIDALPSPEVTLLVRGAADAEVLAARFAARPGVTICCGSIEKLAANPPYDSVVALDGLGRLRSAEADTLSWDETLAQLLALLRPQGRLVLRVENGFGLHRLLALPPAPADSEWVAAGEPVTWRDRLSPVREYAFYPAALLGAEVLGDPALRGYLEATLTATGPAGPLRAGPLLADPARLITGALRYGHATSLAPAWVLVAGDLPAGPPAIVGDDQLRRDDDGRWLAGQTVIPLGRTLEDLLTAAAQRREMPAVRELLTAWQSGALAGVPAAQVVVDAEGEMHGLATAGKPVEALRRLAATMIGGGYAYLWPSPADEAELTALLAGMTGRELEPHDVPPGPAPRPDAGTVRELAMTRDRLEQELADARARHEFYERQIAARDHELKRLRQVNAVLSATVPGKALVSGMKAVRTVVRRVRRR